MRKIEKQMEDKNKKERELHTAFRATLTQMEVEADVTATLNRLFKQRSKPHQGAPKYPIASIENEKDSRPNPLEDPYPDEGVPEPPPPKPPPEELPEGVDEAAFRKTIDLRRERWAVEEDLRCLAAVREEMAGLLEHRLAQQKAAEDKLLAIQRELQEHERVVQEERYDLELLFFLKQGQVEVPQAAVVTDYADAIVVDKSVVEERNTRIRAIAKEKVNSLHTVKQFRKRLNELDWQHKMLALRTDDLEERTKDVHMLRVTKDLQSLLHGAGEESRNKAEAELLERKIEHLHQSLARKEETLKACLGGYTRAVRVKQRENTMLAKKLGELQQNVIQREHIRRLRAPTSGQGQGMMTEKGQKRKIIGGGGKIHENEAEMQAAASQFKELRLRRQIMDAAKKHTDEIDLLRKELDRLRQKTFPSFVRLHDRPPGNPDLR
jgi:hypothetical protein